MQGAFVRPVTETDATVSVECTLNLPATGMRLEVGLVNGEPTNRYAFVQIYNGLNVGLDAALVRRWFRENSRFLECVKKGHVRIVNTETEQDAA